MPNSDYIIKQEQSKEYSLAGSNLHYDEGMTDYSSEDQDVAFIYRAQDMTDYSSDQDKVLLFSTDDYNVYCKHGSWAVPKRREKNETLLGKTLLGEALVKDDDSLDRVLLLIPLDRSAESESLLVYDNGDGTLQIIFQEQSWRHLKNNEPVTQWKQPGPEITQIQKEITALGTQLQSVSEEVFRNDGRLDSYGVLLPALIPVIVAIISASKIWSSRRERALEKQIEEFSQQIEEFSQQIEEFSQQIEKPSKKMKRSRKKSKR